MRVFKALYVISFGKNDPYKSLVVHAYGPAFLQALLACLASIEADAILLGQFFSEAADYELALYLGAVPIYKFINKVAV